ncbi:hypothetical protein BHE74_00057340 [Ensete ventricosum]|nr:hypothetical protein BHE74_00057340 [Ensete ventricosum]
MMSACRGSWPQPGPPQGLLPTAYKRSPVRRQPTGKGTTRKGCRLQGRPRPRAANWASTCRGGVDRKGDRPLAGWLPAGKGSRRLRRGGDVGDAVRVREEDYGILLRKG